MNNVKLLLLIFIFYTSNFLYSFNYVSWNFSNSYSGANYSSNLINQQNARTSDLTNAILSNITLSSNLIATDGNSYHRTKNWNISYSSSRYLEFSITLTNGETFPDMEVEIKTTHAVSSNTGGYRITYSWNNESFAQCGNDITGITGNTLSPYNTFLIPSPNNTSYNLLTIRIHGWITDVTNSIYFGNIEISGEQPLPVDLSFFKANINSNRVNLSWATEKEINNYGFDIERKSLSDNTWQNKGFIKGNGNSFVAHTYNFEDSDIPPGKYNYRLKQTDFNGNFRYFELKEIVEVNIPKKITLLQNFPNPFNTSTIIRFSLPVESNITVKVYDISGKTVRSYFNSKLKSGFYEILFKGDNFPSGIYYYKLTADNVILARKMMLIK